MFSRRDALGTFGGALGSGLALAATPAMAAKASIPSLDTAEGRLRAFMLMRGALDDRLVIGCMNARYWGCVNGAMVPMFDVVSATFSRYRRLPNGDYHGASLEQAYFLDKDSGEWLQSYANPYTGKTVKVPTGGYPATAVVFTTGLEMKVPQLPPGMVLNHTTSPITVQGDDVMLTEVTSATTTLPGGISSPYHEVVGLHARLSEINRSDAKKVRAETSYTSVKAWRTWLDMAGHPGETVSTGLGLYGVRLSDLPKVWLDPARKHRPELLADPLKLLDPAWRA